MPYIIDQVRTWEHEQVKVCSILIENNEIRRIEPSLNNLKFVRMDGRGYYLTPGLVFFDQTLHRHNNFHEFKREVTSGMLERGCTTIVHIVDILYEREALVKLKEHRRKLLNAPIDYVFVIRIPLKKLTPSLIRSCKKWNIPALILTINSHEELSEMPWGWIKESLFPRPICLIPEINTSSNYSLIEKEWKNTVQGFRLLSSEKPVKERTPLSKDLLMKLGLYPERGVIHQGARVTYNLYRWANKSDLVEEIDIVDYDNHIPEIIVHNGIVMKAGERFYFQPGQGQEIQNVYPGRFQMYIPSIMK